MTDYNLLAKAEIDKYTSTAISFSDTALRHAKVFAATAIQGIIDALEKYWAKMWNTRSDLQGAIYLDAITHYTTLKQHIENYKL